MVEDRRVRGQPGHGQFVDIPFERAVVEQIPRDVVEPEALPQVVQRLGGFHDVGLL